MGGGLRWVLGDRRGYGGDMDGVVELEIDVEVSEEGEADS